MKDVIGVFFILHIFLQALLLYVGVRGGCAAGDALAVFAVTVLSDCVTSYDKKKLPEMLAYYESKGCSLSKVAELSGSI